MGRETVLSDEQRRALAALRPVALAEHLYLAGGTAVALHLGHRRSLDLDLFSERADLDLDSVRRRLPQAEVEVVSATDVAVHLRWSGAAVDVVRYPYAPLEAPIAGPEGVPLAGLRDLAVMKLAAIARRGIRRDFWDAWVIFTTTNITMTQAFDDYLQKFGVAESSLYHVMRALTYFDDAERDPVVPAGMDEELWASIRRWFELEAPKELARRAP